jgi:hypothetical protein
MESTFMRELLGMSADFEFKNPDVSTDFRELLGVPLFGIFKTPQVVVGLGCSYGCDFCSPSHFFGCRHIRFYKNGKTLFGEILRISKRFRSIMITFIGTMTIFFSIWSEQNN